MFIRKTTHTNNKNGQAVTTYKLIESVRTERGPRQRTVLNLGSDFNLDPEQWKELADRIEQIISGQTCLFPVPEQIEQAARRYAQQIIRRHGQQSPVSVTDQDKPDYQTVDLNSLESEQIRSVGGESVVLAAIRELELDNKFEALGFNKPNIEAAIGVIAARLLAPAFERATHVWLQRETALDDLMEAHFEPLSQDRVYKVSDMLLRNKDEIEGYLQDRERHLFDLDENTALRSDQHLFRGKGSLSKIFPAISATTRKPVVVADAGIGTQENVRWLTENGYAYVVVSRKRSLDLPAGMEMTPVRQDDRRIVRAAIRENASQEVTVYCHSTAKDDTSGNAKDVIFRIKPTDDESGYYVLRTNLTHADAKPVYHGACLSCSANDP